MLLLHVVWRLTVTDKNWNFSAVRSPIELKFIGDCGLVSQIWLQDSNVCLNLNVNKQTKKPQAQKTWR
jgi:hypothetical protein